MKILPPIYFVSDSAERKKGQGQEFTFFWGIFLLIKFEENWLTIEGTIINDVTQTGNANKPFGKACKVKEVFKSKKCANQEKSVQN